MTEYFRYPFQISIVLFTIDSAGSAQGKSARICGLLVVYKTEFSMPRYDLENDIMFLILSDNAVEIMQCI